jgi:hypothetical protein
MTGLNHEWRKSTRSGTNGNCVEARYVNDTAEVRDSKDRRSTMLAFSPAAWTAFVSALKSPSSVRAMR